jgi:hypothetical protein
MTIRDSGQTVAAAEGWFVEHGLPWFVDAHRRRVRAGLGRARLARMCALVGALSAGVGVLVGRALGDPSVGVVTALSTAGLALAAYAVRFLHAGTVLKWAGRRTLGSLGLLFPLASRALPMLLLFMTFLFINTEVWQVAARLDGGVMVASLMLFGAIGVGFLLARLPEELDVFDDEISHERLELACQGTPLEATVAELELTEEELHRHSDVVGLERANLILVLLLAQAIQVLLLSIAVWLFFLVFGAVAIDDEVVRLWIANDPTPTWVPRVSRELIRVATFLAGFAGLYFTVYAVTDGTYRQQFFTRITRELERAVSVRLVYRKLKD